MPSYTSKKLAFNNAEQFKESFYEPEPATIGYVFIGNHLEYANEDSPDTISDTVADEKTVWDNMYAAKKITGNDVELVVPRVNWTSNTKYRQFDDTTELSILISANTSLNLKPMYIINSERNVYKCLCNNVSANSTVEPLSKNLAANGNIATDDGFLWKYMYNIKPSSKFLTETWMPAPISNQALEYSSDERTAVDGELSKIVMTNQGSGYTYQNVRVQTFATGCTKLTVLNTADSNVFNIAANTTITGTGIPGGAYIESVTNANSVIVLSTATSSSGGGNTSAAALNSAPRIYVNGNGTTVVASPRVNSGKIEKVTVTTIGEGYTKANVFIYGTGTNATARAVLPTKFGHTYNAARELGASNVMVAVRLGEVDSTENGIISTDTSFRQYGLLRDPYKYGQVAKANTTTANSVVSQTTNLTLIAGSNYDLNEFVYQGTVSSPTFSGYVHAFTANQVRLTRTEGTASVGGLLKGLTNNPTGRTVVSIGNPEFQPETGSILHVENVTKVQRTDGQAENIKFVIKF